MNACRAQKPRIRTRDQVFLRVRSTCCASAATTRDTLISAPTTTSCTATTPSAMRTGAATPSPRLRGHLPTRGGRVASKGIFTTVHPSHHHHHRQPVGDAPPSSPIAPRSRPLATIRPMIAPQNAPVARCSASPNSAGPGEMAKVSPAIPAPSVSARLWSAQRPLSAGELAGHTA